MSVFGIGRIGQIAALFALIASSGLAEARTVYVNRDVEVSGSGKSWGSAFKYLRDALDETFAGDKIFVAKGTYYPDEGTTGFFGDRELSLEIRGQEIYGGFDGTETKISQRNPNANVTVLSGAIWDGADAGDYWSLHVMVVSEDSLLDGFIVENGHASGADSWNYPRITEFDEGGGCYIKAGNKLTLENCNFRNNRALENGGAIMIEDGDGKVIAKNCVFQGNSIRLDYNVTPGVSGGGAIMGNVDATNCKFISNGVTTNNVVGKSVSKAFGGAIAGNVTAVGTEFIGNRAIAQYTSFSTEKPDCTADGGAVSGNLSATQCVFSGNQAIAREFFGVSSGGAISGQEVEASNCSFTGNLGGAGIFEEDENTTLGGGGAVYTRKGDSILANCVFVNNSSAFRGGAIQGGVDTASDALTITNCTFLDNKVATGLPGAALSCGGIVRSLNNIFWFTTASVGDFDQDKPIHVGQGVPGGTLRNSDKNYPTPSSAAANIVKGGVSSISRGTISDIFLVSPGVLILDQDPLFVNAIDPDGEDDRWGTADDGLRLISTSPAIGKQWDSRVRGFVNVLPNDVTDADQDGNLSEKLPVDLRGAVRVQDRFVEIGAYEFGNIANVPEIAVLEGTRELVSGGLLTFKTIAKGEKIEKTLTIRNLGPDGLRNISVAISSTKDFQLKKPLADTLEQGKEATVTVIFSPKSSGSLSAKLTILSNDADESPFVITFKGKVSGKTNSFEKSATNPRFLAAARLDDPTLNSSLAPAESVPFITRKIASDGARYLVLTVLKSELLADQTVEVSSNLIDWKSGPKHTTVLVDSPTMLSVRDNTPLNDGGKRFIRLK